MYESQWRLEVFSLIITVLYWFLWLILIQGTTRAGRCPNQGCRLEIPSIRYEEAREMTTLNLSCICIESTPSGLGLQNYPNLENVYFNFRGIATIKKGSFEDMESLKTLYLSRNSLFFLSDDAFRGAENLEEIDISNNLLQLIGEPFANLTHLEHLDLSHNAIEVIKRHAFANSQNLTTLNLSSNSLTNGSIHAQSFRGLSSLRKLDLSDNQLYNIASGSLSHLTNLRWLSLSGNFLSEIDMSLWPRAGNLHSVFLTSNHYLTSLTNIPESIQTLDTVPVPCADKSPRQVSPCVPDEDNIVCYSHHCKLVCQGLTSIPAINGKPIKSLHLTDNYIGSVSKASMADYYNLIRLFLDSNLIEEIQDGAFHGMKNLTSLHLNKNHLSRLTNETFSGMECLAKLDLSNNKLYFIKDIFANLSNLTHLHLGCNDIKHIDYGRFPISTT
ncbi:hypothetical protein BSL78_00952 [Apostichopus japonicus]|uniref:Uncharacterized protein n=1 Tax=Stichopus japonicus TaxID=307972 RepID=A0A2G8LPJ3_STIJA|nr:hypothetical protein BSL78_00952 [Apostichopus japonicus]